MATSGSVSPSVTTLYAITCDGPGGSAQDEATVVVPAPSASALVLAALGATAGLRIRAKAG